MTKKHRFIILGICITLFLIATPYIILHSLGYKIDFAGKKIIATGGIYVKALPLGADVTVDSYSTKTSIFSNDVFVQNLLPKDYLISIQREGYYDYQKNLPVKDKEVTKLEHVTLIRKDIPFALQASRVDYFSLSPDGNIILTAAIGSKQIDFEAINTRSQEKKNASFQAGKDEVSDVQWSTDASRALIKTSNSYLLLNFSSPILAVTPLPLLNQAKDASFNSQNSEEIFFIKNKNLNSTLKTAPVLKNVAAYRLENQTILWLSSNGFLQNADLLGGNIRPINSEPLQLKETAAYAIKVVDGRTFVSEDNTAYLLNPVTLNFEKLNFSVSEIRLSPDGNKILYCNDHENLLTALNANTSYLMNADPSKIVPIYTSPEKLRDCYWFNDDYIIFSLGNTVAISEIDSRDKVNIIHFSNIPQHIPQLDSVAEIKDPKIAFDTPTKTLYLLTEQNLYTSQILP